MRIRIAIHLLAVGVLGGFALAADAPLGTADFAPSLERPFGWRGDGTGRFPNATPPTTWSDTKNVRWSVVVGSGYSSPILTQKLVFVTAEPNRLTCLDRAAGKVRWQLAIKPGALADEKARTMAAAYEPPMDGSGLMAATPITDGKSVYVALANGIVAAVDLEGKLRWTAFIDADQNTGYGRSSSPLLVAGKLIVHMTNLYAFDPATGKQLWVNTEAASKYGSPTAVKVGAADLIVTPAGDAVRVDDGKAVAADVGAANHSSPVALDGVIFYGETSASAARFDSKFKSTEIWNGTIADEVFGSPLLHDGVLFTANGKGDLYAFDARGKGDQKPLIDGRSLFGKPEGDAPVVYASVTLAGKHLFVHSTRGETVVLEATREAKLVARNRLPSGTGASPIFSGSELFLRDGNKLICIAR